MLEVDAVPVEGEVELGRVVGPAGELEVARLVVEGEPRDVDLAHGLEDARRDVDAGAVAAHHHVGLVGGVELLGGGVVQQEVGDPQVLGRDADVAHVAVVALGREFNLFIITELFSCHSVHSHRVPDQIVVVPLQVEPHVGLEHLVLLVKVDDLLEVKGELKKK